MSCVVKVKDVVVLDLASLSAACDRLGLELVRDQTSYARHHKGEGSACEHAIRIKGSQPHFGMKGPWEIGLVPNPDGAGWLLAYDSWGPHGRKLEEVAGSGLSQLKIELGMEMATQQMYADGFTNVYRVMTEAGEHQLIGEMA